MELVLFLFSSVHVGMMIHILHSSLFPYFHSYTPLSYIIVTFFLQVPASFLPVFFSNAALDVDLSCRHFHMSIFSKSAWLLMLSFLKILVYKFLNPNFPWHNGRTQTLSQLLAKITFT
jgi:hypothetical protein